MRFLDKISLVIILLGLLPQLAWSTHNRAGEITYEQIDDQTIKATITTYTKTSSASADRDSVEVFWGDGSSEFVLRTNGTGDLLPNDIKVNFYMAEHTYPGRGTYTISMTDPNRVASILNVNFPNSVNVPFYIETTFTLLNPLFQGRNNSVVLLQPPIDFACVGQVFVHNPNAFDADGDSIAYEYTIPRFERESDVPEYVFPDDISPGDNNMITLDPISGSFVWRSPQRAGEYNIAFKIQEYRQGVLINSTTRDMQIFVRGCDDVPPSIDVVSDLCVVAGENISIPVNVSDMDVDQLVSLSASGGPFTFDDSPAVLEGANQFLRHPYTATLNWQTTCNHISGEAYQIVFRAVDNSFGDTTGLADLKTLRIKVIGPPPLDVMAESTDGTVDLSWEQPYECESADNGFFLGFSVWRKTGTTTLAADSCRAGLDGSPYEEIIFITNESEDGRYVINDPNVEPRTIYCYRVLGEFSRLTDSGNPFNKVSSIASDEFCILIKQDFPLLTEASVVTTDGQAGSISITWTKPIAEDLDTLMNPGPYRYQLLSRVFGSNDPFVEIADANFVIDNFSDPVDTTYIHNGLNTVDNSYEYRISFYATDINSEPSSPEDAGSIYLSITPTDQANQLSWTVDVPWENQEYIIYKEIDGVFDSVGITRGTSYVDRGLANGDEYCYFVQSLGTYGLSTTPPVIINDSQKTCGTPVDDLSTCEVEINVNNVCNDPFQFRGTDSSINEISWQVASNTCDDEEIISGFNVYYGAEENVNFEFVGSTLNQSFEHSPEFGVEGCYAVTTLDQLGNESGFSNVICIVNCPNYSLPNTFTPNNDGANDLFRPIESQFIARVDMDVFNRWGQKVFSTEDPQLNWDGRNSSGNELAEGVYYYSCRVFEAQAGAGEIETDILNGVIHLIKGQ